MTPVKIRKDSWHYRFMNAYDSDGMSDISDICAYRTRLLKSAAMAILLSTIALAVVFFITQVLVHTVLAVGFSIAYGTWIVTLPAVLGMLGFGVAAIYCGGFVAAGVAAAYGRKVTVQLAAQEPGAVRAAYRSWKDKVCVPVVFVNSQDSK